ncbi:MAG: response regulator [Desulfobacterales bacterium]|nr:response regulator [Desulfobacterales bacterium]
MASSIQDAKIPFFSKLSTTILISFILLFLIPMILIMYTSFQAIETTAFSDAQKALKSVAMERKNHIETLFEKAVTDLELQARHHRNAQFMTNLTLGLLKSGNDSAKFIRTREWESIVKNYSSDILRFLKVHELYDIFFIDPSGNILYNVTREKDLGTNLFHGQSPHAKSKFSKTVKKVLTTGKPAISDFDTYAFSKHGIFNFMVAPIRDKAQDTLGLIAFQFPISHINRISQLDVALGSSIEVFLVGNDLTLRSDSKLDPTLRILESQVNTLGAKLWKQSLELNTQSKRSGQPDRVYMGLHGEDVLGIHETIQVLNMSFGILAEISKKEAFASMDEFRSINAILFLIISFAVLIFAVLLSQRIVQPLVRLSESAHAVSMGDYSQVTTHPSRNEIGHLSRIFSKMIVTLEKTIGENQQKTWMATGQSRISGRPQRETDLKSLCNAAISEISVYLDARAGALYLIQADGNLKCRGQYALFSDSPARLKIQPGEGLAGQVAQDKETRLLTEVPGDYLPVTSGLGKTDPVSIIIHPFTNDGKVIGVIEIAALYEFGQREIHYLESISPVLSTATLSIKARDQEQTLLRKIKTQHEELKASNEELEEQAYNLKTSQDELQTQSEELRAANEDLTEKTQRLSKQQAELEESRQELADKANKLTQANQYKSEFLANMSHELRSPLNSLLILAQNLAENSLDNLNPDQVKSAKIIYNGGRELLTMINDILDLSKIEAGRMEVHPESLSLEPFLKEIKDKFESQGREKGLRLAVEIDPSLPRVLETDTRLLGQILNNFMSNAIKFTHEGSVTLKAHKPESENHETHMALSVVDTGIGIPKEQQDRIFDAFTQADGTTTRKYGGTGLGLSISRQLTNLLQGEILLESTEDQGTTFTIQIPLVPQAAPSQFSPPPPAGPRTDRQPSPSKLKERSLLIIEDDLIFADVVKAMAEDKGYHAVIAATGRQGLELAMDQPPSGIVLDLALPDMEGKQILETLKADHRTAHVPIHVISGRDEMTHCLENGAMGFLLKPAGRNEIHLALEQLLGDSDSGPKKLLLVEDDPVHQGEIQKLLTNDKIQIMVKDNGADAIDAIRETEFHCIILDLTLTDMGGLDVLNALAGDENQTQNLPPVLVYTSKDLSRREMNQVLQYAQKVIPKGPDGFQRLKDEVTLFFHTMESKISPGQRPQTPLIHDDQAVFQNKEVLLVDDDMRNIYAMSGLLQQAGMKVTMAENGLEALKKVQSRNFDIVLMDIMMPEMDGYQATMEIRKQKDHKGLPIIALTAKAMPEDREKCLRAGVNDYLAKPVDRDKLFSILKVWLYSA